MITTLKAGLKWHTAQIYGFIRVNCLQSTESRPILWIFNIAVVCNQYMVYKHRCHMVKMKWHAP